jgi:hypothetical protein
VSHAGLDGSLASGAPVRLDRLVRLDRVHDLAIEARKIVRKTVGSGSLYIGHAVMVERSDASLSWLSHRG